MVPVVPVVHVVPVVPVVSVNILDRYLMDKVSKWQNMIRVEVAHPDNLLWPLSNG